MPIGADALDERRVDWARERVQNDSTTKKELAACQGRISGQSEGGAPNIPHANFSDRDKVGALFVENNGTKQHGTGNAFCSTFRVWT